MKIGFVGQGWIGKNYADDFEARGYDVVRYALEEPYRANKDLVAECDIVFIAVPTPTTELGFDDSIVRAAMKLVGKGKTAVVKSTILPGTTVSIQKENPGIFVMHSPEFLVEASAAHDAAHPNRNIVGVPVESDEYRAKAQAVLDVLPDAPYERIMSSHDAEFVKYAGNCYLFTKVIFMNVLYDLVRGTGGDWTAIRDALIHDPRIGTSHTTPVDTRGGRGAGGHCFIKDFEAFRAMYDAEVGDATGSAFLAAMKDKNIRLLLDSGKDVDLVTGVYGKKI
jgi:UDPglucose 6-dehydrogenase